MSQKKNVKVSFKDREIQTQCDRPNPIAEPKGTRKVNGIELFTYQIKYCNKVSIASRRTHMFTQYPYNGDIDISMIKLFTPKELDVVNNMLTIIDRACYIISENAPISIYNQLIERNEYVYQRFMSNIEHIEDPNKANDIKRLAILNLLSDNIINIDWALNCIDTLLCPNPDTESSITIVIRPNLADVCENMLMLRDYIEKHAKL